MVKDKFLQFPLSLLLNNEENLFDLILAYAMHYAGSDYLKKLQDDTLKDMPDEYSHRQPFEMIDEDDDLQLALAWGADVVGFQIGSIRHEIDALEAARDIVDTMNREHGKSPFVRLRVDLFLGARESKAKMSRRDMLCYMGLLAIVGKSRCKQVSYDRILWAAHGCKSERMFNQEVDEPWITLRQIQRGIESMQKKRFISSIVVNRRFKYYSVKLPQKQLENAVKSEIKKQAEIAASRKTIHISV